MQEENVTPNDEFLYELGKFLESNDKPVPFVIPEKPVIATSDSGKKIINPDFKNKSSKWFAFVNLL